VNPGAGEISQEGSTAVTTTTKKAALVDRDQIAQARRAAGYWPAPTPGRCGVCRGRIHQGQWIRKLPDSYRPDSKRRHAHYACIAKLIAEIRQRVQVRGAR
jgi:hypothetical protein